MFKKGAFFTMHILGAVNAKKGKNHIHRRISDNRSISKEMATAMLAETSENL
jgi:hypothetical protein